VLVYYNLAEAGIILRPCALMPDQTSSTAPILDAQFMARLSQLSLVAPRSFPGASMGKRFSRSRGTEGMEFADHKEYSPGDDFRNIDWNVYARLDELVVKNFETQETLRLNVLLDTSASMNTGTPSKADVARRLAAALAYIGFINEDWTGVYSFSNKLGESYAPAGKPRTAALLDFLGQSAAQGQTDFRDAFKGFTIQQGRPGLAVIISDFCNMRGLDEGLKFLVYNNFIVIALHIIDPEEEAPDLAGEVDLVDTETGESVPLTVRGNTLVEFQKMYRAHLASVAKAFAVYDATYLRISTRDDLKQVIMNTFKQQRLVRQR
jgi:uncharacterized protein (DUF58 family)